MEAEVRKQDGTVISEKRDVTIVDTANPFGNLAEIDIEDDSGNLYDEFGFGTRIEVYVRDLLTNFEVENEDDILIEENETVTIKGGDNRTIQETDTLSIAQNETETGRVIANEGVVSNAGTFTSIREVRKQRVWSNQGIVTNYDTAQSIADDPRPDFLKRFTGYVVERNDQNENSGRDNLQLTVYSFDQLLRADSVSNDQTGNTITEALEDIIKTDTAVTWNATNVDVVDEQELTESLQGEKVEDALLKLSKKSVDEDFGVNDDIEFFFREQEPVSAPSDITDADWIDYQLPERGEENKNESRTYFNADSTGDSDRVAVVDDGVNQLELQESLGTDDPVVIADDRDRNDLTDVDDAAEDSEQNLDDKEVARVYEFVAEAEDFLEAQPGQVFDVTIETAGIDGEFRIAELEYSDVGSTVRITAIRNKGNTDDVLRRVTERLRRKELETADFDGPEDRINIAEVGVEIADTLTVDGTTWDSTRVTNTIRNQIRDGWGGRGNVNVSEIAVGTDPSGLARTNESLENQVATASVTETLDGNFAVDYDASFTQSDIQEVGLLDGSGNLLYRAVNDTAASPGDISIGLTVNNNPEIPKAVVTDLGRESIRDIIADNSPALPVNYGFGSDQTEPSTSDTSLGNSLYVADLNNSLIQSAETQGELEELVGTVDNTTPLFLENGTVGHYQSCFTTEAENFDNGNPATPSALDSDASDGQYVLMQRNTDEFIEFNFTLDYDIPASDFAVFVRDARVTTTTTLIASYSVFLDGTTVADNVNVSRGEDEWGWQTIGSNNTGFSLTGEIEAGTHTLRIEENAPSNDDENLGIDVVAPADNRYNYTLDNTLSGTDGYLDGPELYADLLEKQFDQVANTRRELDQANAQLTINDTSNNQFVELSNDGGSTFIRGNNTADFTANFSGLSREVITRVGLSRFGSRTGETPLTGFNPQEISVYTLFANPKAVVADGLGTALTIGIVPRNEIVGSTISELGQLDSSENTLTRSIRAELVVESEMRVFGRERLLITQA